MQDFWYYSSILLDQSGEVINKQQRGYNVKRSQGLTIAVITVLLLVAQVWAFSPVEENAAWEIPRLGAPSQLIWDEHAVGDAKGLMPTAAEAFSTKYGGDWFYQMNTATGTYHHVYGSGVQLADVPSSPDEAENLARSFIRDNQGIFLMGDGDLAVMNNTNALGKWSVVFQQTYEGLNVYGGRAHVVFTETGSVFEMGSDVYPGIDISVNPVLTMPEALDIAEYDIGFQEDFDKMDLSDLMILPVEQGESGMDYRLSYRFELRVIDPFGLWVTWVDANTGEILWRENHIRFADFTGNVQGDVEWDGYCDGFTNDFPLKNMRITISGVGTGYTDENGDFILSGGAGSRTITAGFNGYWVDVDRYTGTDAEHSGTITDGSPYTIDWHSGNSLDSERDCFAYVNNEHDWLKDLDPVWTGMDYEMTCTVERTDLYCPGNAWWDGSSINFCVQSVDYGNTGRMADVLYHEYGHGITDFLYGAYDPPSDLHEGNSDIVANLILRESIMGLGFYLNNCSVGIRDSDNSITYPCGGSGHYCGQVIAGFHWDSWQELLAAYPQAYADSVAANTWHYGRKLGLPQTMPDQVHWTFVADDDDGNLSNGTPHYDEFCVGATNHGFDCPTITVGVFITHTPLDDTGNTTTPYQVVATITSSGGSVVEDSCRVTYRVGGGSFASATMTSTGTPDEYEGFIPAQAACSQVDYYIFAADDNGYDATDPAAAPGNLHTFLVGYETVFEDDFETDKGWTAGLPGDDASTGMWERCDPEWTEAQAEDDHTPASGVNAYITDCTAGASQGSYDVDGGKTTLLSPMFDLTTYENVTLSYYRWYSNDTGAEPGTDYWVVELTDDDWTTWATLENTNVSNRNWTEMEFDVGSYVDLTDQVQVRFIASDFDPGSLVEAGVDDFLLVGCSASEDTTPPTVTVLDPNGGEQMIGGGGSTHTIRWNSNDNVGVVTTHILWSTDGGATYPDTLVSGALDSTWVWGVPDVDEPDCRIKVVCLDAASNGASDQSDADFEIVSVAGLPGVPDTPAEAVLFQNRPSPFKAATDIEFGVPRSAEVTLRVYAVDGRLVATLADGTFPSGYHVVTWRGADDAGNRVADGVYFYRLRTPDKTLTRKMLMLR
jgi:hypothetical protein